MADEQETTTQDSTPEEMIREGISSQSEEAGPTPGDPQQESSQDNSTEDEAPAQKQESEDLSTATTQGESEDTGEEAESDEPSEEEDDTPQYYVETEESTYKADDWEDMRETLEEAYSKKDELINKYESEKEELSEQAKNEISQLEEEKSEIEAKLKMYEDNLAPEKREEMLINQFYLPEEYQGKTLDDFEDEDERVEFQVAKREAKNQFEREVKQVTEDLKETKQKRREQRIEAREKAENFVSENLNEEDFNAKNPEDRAELEDYLDSKEYGEGDNAFSKRDAAVFMAEYLPQDVVQIYLKGLESDFVGDTQRQIEEQVEESKPTQDTETAAPPKEETPEMSPEDMIRSGLTV